MPDQGPELATIIRDETREQAFRSLVDPELLLR
jgi:hypothetical protein